MILFSDPAKLFRLLVQAFREFGKNDPLRMAAATAFFATFALPAILIILIQVFGLIVTPRIMGRQLLQGLSDVIGTHTATELRSTLRNVRHLASTWYIAIGGFIFLLFVSTTLFKVIKDSLNQLWGIKVIDKAGLVFQLKHRAKSFVAILLAGVLFILALLAEGIMTVLKEYIGHLLPGASPFVNVLLSQLISLAVVTAWFTLLFRFLADGHSTLRVTISGAFFTALLFTLGKFLLRWLLSYSNMQTIYGTSTSFVLLLLFIFYCSFIFYYGACFTKVWAGHRENPIIPGRYAVSYRIAQIETDEKSLQ